MKVEIASKLKELKDIIYSSKTRRGKIKKFSYYCS
jgi:hypothetical protein